jgi:hypothetical protein
LCPGEQDYAMLVRHLRGQAHEQTPAQIRALLPPGYKTRPPRNRRNAPPAADPADEDLVDEEEVDDDLEGDEALVDAEADAASDTDSLHTVSTVAQSRGTTPAPSRSVSPVLVRIGSNHINAIPGHEDDQSTRSRATSGASSASSGHGVANDPGVGLNLNPNVDPWVQAHDEVFGDAGTLPPPSRTGSRASGKYSLSASFNILI